MKPAPTTGSWPMMGSLALMLALTLGFLLRARPGLAYLFVPCDGCSWRGSNERNGATTLRSVVAAQRDFRDQDRDGNEVKDFWRGDIAGLYTKHSALDPKQEAIRLIELSCAAADDRPVSDIRPYSQRSAKAGYWFRAILHEEEIVPSPERFAACAFPDSRSAGRYTFIVSEENVVYRKDLGAQRGVERFPQDPVKAGWEKVY